MVTTNLDASSLVKKTAFRTVISDFHYIIMPFGFKNVEATYWQAMTASSTTCMMALKITSILISW